MRWFPENFLGDNKKIDDDLEILHDTNVFKGEISLSIYSNHLHKKVPYAKLKTYLPQSNLSVNKEDDHLLNILMQYLVEF